jgi:hypothetical protein
LAKKIKLPPLSVGALNDIEKAERFIRGTADEGYASIDKWSRILRTTAVNVFVVQLTHYVNTPGYNSQWVPAVIEETVSILLEALDRTSLEHLAKNRLRREIRGTLNQYYKQLITPKASVPKAPSSPKELRDYYLALFPAEKIKILDICWAAGQHYSEWKRWLKGEMKESSLPDRSIRALLTSGQKPLDYRKAPRPDGWK